MPVRRLALALFTLLVAAAALVAPPPALAADTVKPTLAFTLGDPLDNPTDHRPPTVPMRLALSPDDSRLHVLRADGSLDTWNVRTRAKLATRETNGLFAYADEDGRLLTRSDEGSATMLTRGGTQPSLFSTTSKHAALSGDGGTLAVVGEFGRVDVWSLGATPTSTTLQTALPARNGLAVSRDGSLIAAAEGTYSDDGGHTAVVEVWRNGESERVLYLDEGDAGVVLGVWNVVFSPDGSLLAADTQKDGRSGVRVWEIPSGRVVLGSDGFNSYWVRAVAFSEDGKLVATGDEKGTIWVRGVAGESGTRHISRPGVVQSLAFSRDGQYLVVGNWDSTVEFWRITPDG